jgi:hypothetical protein
MKSIIGKASAIAVCVACALPVAAQSTTGAPGTGAAGDTTSSRDRDDGFDLGWLGLIGLVGLVGLRRKKDAYDGTRTGGTR